jgi:hypothetical protein
MAYFSPSIFLLKLNILIAKKFNSLKKVLNFAPQNGRWLLLQYCVSSMTLFTHILKPNFMFAGAEEISCNPLMLQLEVVFISNTGRSCRRVVHMLLCLLGLGSGCVKSSAHTVDKIVNSLALSPQANYTD